MHAALMYSAPFLLCSTGQWAPTTIAASYAVRSILTQGGDSPDRMLGCLLEPITCGYACKRGAFVELLAILDTTHAAGPNVPRKDLLSEQLWPTGKAPEDFQISCKLTSTLLKECGLSFLLERCLDPPARAHLGASKICLVSLRLLRCWLVAMGLQ